MSPSSCNACGKSGGRLLRCGRCRAFCNRECQVLAARQATPATTAAPPAENLRTRRPMPRWRRACQTPPRRPRRAWIRHRWRPLRTHATHVARATAGSCAVVGAGACGSATASVRRLRGKSSATGVPTADPPTERRSRNPQRTHALPLPLRRDPPRRSTC